jgi:hypothetical protein
MGRPETLLSRAWLLAMLYGDVLAAAGRPDDAAAALEQALDRCLRKKNLALARQVSERLADLPTQAAST